MLGWLWWEAGRLELVSQRWRSALESVGQVHRDQLDDLGFAVDRHWLLSIPAQSSHRIWARPPHGEWTALPDPPPCEDSGLGLYPGPGLACIVEPDRFHFASASQSWQTLELPEGAQWVSPAADGGWWAVGSIPAKRVRRAEKEVAAWKRDAGGGLWDPLEIRASSLWQATRTIAAGGFESLIAVDGSAEPLVLVSECARFHEDQSNFLFVRQSDATFAIQRLKDCRVARLLREKGGRPLTLTVDGEMWCWPGRKWRPRGTAKTLRRTLSNAGLPHGFAQLCPQGQRIACRVQCFRDGHPSEKAALMSEDGGDSWRIESVSHPQDTRQLVCAWAATEI